MGETRLNIEPKAKESGEGGQRTRTRAGGKEGGREGGREGVARYLATQFEHR
jgi:hypothetical protein